MKSSWHAFIVGCCLVLSVSHPAYGQYIYLDLDGDGVCSSADIPTAATTSIDVYLDTNHDANGREATCGDGTSPLNMFSYDLVLAYKGAGAVTFQSFTPDRALLDYAILSAFTAVGNEVGVGYSKKEGTDGPGRFKLGTFHVAVVGHPAIVFEATPQVSSIPSGFTGFGSQCAGSMFSGTIALGYDFTDTCSFSQDWSDAVQLTTWGKIKQIYR